MAYDKVVDSTFLDGGLTLIADAIREKNGSADELLFPDDFVTAIAAIEGGGSGATLVVNSSGTGIVTVSNAELGKSYSKAVTMGGSVEFKGLATGTWTVTLSNDIQSTTQTVSIAADYSVAVAFFAATINITYPEGSTCTATDGVSTFTAPDTSGTWALVVPNTGTWTISATDGTDTTSETVEITTEGQSVSVELSYWNGELYARGNEYENITGGWGLRYSEGTGGTVTVESERIIISANQGNIGSGSVVYAGPENLIDLTNFSVFSAKMTKVSGGTIKVSLSVAESVGSGPLAYSNEVALTANVESEITLDVSAISGKKAVYVSAANSGANGAAAEAALLECELVV